MFFRRAKKCKKSFFANGPAKNHSRPVGPAEIPRNAKNHFRKRPRKKTCTAGRSGRRPPKCEENIHGRPGHHPRNSDKIVKITRGFGGEKPKISRILERLRKKNIHGPSDWVPAKVEMRKMIFRIGPRKKHARPPRLWACVKKTFTATPTWCVRKKTFTTTLKTPKNEK